MIEDGTEADDHLINWLKVRILRSHQKRLGLKGPSRFDSKILNIWIWYICQKIKTDLFSPVKKLVEIMAKTHRIIDSLPVGCPRFRRFNPDFPDQNIIECLL
jgi:hypothetical protein